MYYCCGGYACVEAGSKYMGNLYIPVCSVVNYNCFYKIKALPLLELSELGNDWLEDNEEGELERHREQNFAQLLGLGKGLDLLSLVNKCETTEEV